MKTSFTVPAYISVATSALNQYVNEEREDIPNWSISLRDGIAPVDYCNGYTYIPVGIVEVQIPSADVLVAAELVALQAEINRQSIRFAETMRELEDRRTELTAITHQPEGGV